MSSPSIPSPSAERQLKGFISKFDPAHQTLIRAVRQTLRKRFPTAYELAYDNYNFFVIGYGPTERPSDCIVSLVAGAYLDISEWKNRQVKVLITDVMRFSEESYQRYLQRETQMVNDARNDRVRQGYDIRSLRKSLTLH